MRWQEPLHCRPQADFTLPTQKVFPRRSATGFARLTSLSVYRLDASRPGNRLYVAIMITTMAHSGRFDPRDFISTPYRTCPECGHETFGILLIRDNRYTRRCRDCWHSSEYRLPELRRKIIYLDQFVISNLMKLVTPSAKGREKVKADAFWQELHDLLIQSVTFSLSYAPTRNRMRTSP